MVYRNKSEYPQGPLRRCPFRIIIVIGLNLGLMTSPVTDILIEILSNQVYVVIIFYLEVYSIKTLGLS